MSGAAAARPNDAAYRRITLIGIGVLAALGVLIVFAPGWIARLQAVGFDGYQILKPRRVESTPVMVVEIDDRSLARLGQWPWPRTKLAELISAIQRHDPAAIGIDILMSEPDRLSPERLLLDARRNDPALGSLLDALPSSDTQLARAIAAGSVVLPFAGMPESTGREPMSPPLVVVDRAPRDAPSSGVAANVVQFPGARANVDELDRAAAGHGAISAEPTANVIRHVPLVVRVGERLVPSLAAEMLRVAFGAPDIRVYARGPRVETIGIGDFVAPTEGDGQMRIYFSGRDSRRHVSAIDVLDGVVDPVRLERKLVLVGATGLALVDFQSTPVGERMPGSEIHAQLLENIVDQTWLTRPWWARWAELAVFVTLGLLLVQATPRWRPGAAALLALGCMALPLVAGFAAFAGWRLVFDAVLPSLGLLLLFVALLVPTLAEAGRQRRTLEQTVRMQREQAAYVDGELAAARRIQLGFLPRPDAVAGDARIEIAASMTPAREVGGDLYDFFRLDERRVFFLIGDVAGKGLSASLFMAVGKALYKSIMLRNPHATISQIMRHANDEVSRDNPEMFFVTAFAGILDLETGDLAYCNAGHDDAYVLGASGRPVARLRDGAGPALCAIEGFAYPSGQRRMQPGDVLCLVTDGVLDAQKPGGERYGSARLDALMTRLQRDDTTASGLVEALCADVRAFAAGAEPADDLTVLAWRWNGPSPPRADTSRREPPERVSER